MAGDMRKLALRRDADDAEAPGLAACVFLEAREHIDIYVRTRKKCLLKRKVKGQSGIVFLFFVFVFNRKSRCL